MREFLSEHLGTFPPPDPLANLVLALWIQYHLETESFDRSLEHEIHHGIAHVAPWHRSTSIRYAAQADRRRRASFRVLGVTPGHRLFNMQHFKQLVGHLGFDQLTREWQDWAGDLISEHFPEPEFEPSRSVGLME